MSQTPGALAPPSSAAPPASTRPAARLRRPGPARLSGLTIAILLLAGCAGGVGPGAGGSPGPSPGPDARAESAAGGPAAALARRARQAHEAGRHAEAVGYYALLWQGGHGTPAQVPGYAESLRRSGAPERAVALLTPRVEQGRAGARELVTYAKAQLQLEAAERALPAARRAVDLAPEAPEPRIALGLALDATGDHGGAVRAYHAALSRGAEDTARVLNNMGLAETRRGRPEAGLEALRKARRLDPDNPAIERNLNMVRELIARRQAALSTFDRVARQVSRTDPPPVPPGQPRAAPRSTQSRVTETGPQTPRPAAAATVPAAEPAPEPASWAAIRSYRAAARQMAALPARPAAPAAAEPASKPAPEPVSAPAPAATPEPGAKAGETANSPEPADRAEPPAMDGPVLAVSGGSRLRARRALAARAASGRADIFYLEMPAGTEVRLGALLRGLRPGVARVSRTDLADGAIRLRFDLKTGTGVTIRRDRQGYVVELTQGGA